MARHHCSNSKGVLSRLHPSLFRRFGSKKFNASHIKTIGRFWIVNQSGLGIDYIGVEYKHQKGDGEVDVVNVKIWDTAGQERFHTITQQFYRQAQGMIIAFDLTNRKTFENVKTWISSIYKLAPDSTLPKVLVGNKLDLPDRVVLKSEGQKLAEEHGIEYFETSAMENINVQEMMNHIFKLVYVRVVSQDEEEVEMKSKSIVIDNKANSESGGGGWTNNCTC